MKTDSEIQFEQFCKRNRFRCERVSETTTQTPDYELMLDGQLVVVEVKEVLPTPEEIESDRLCAQRGYGNVISITPGKTVRKKIADSSKQINARTQGKYPGMLVLWERGQCAGRHTEPYHIHVAMAGFEDVLLSVPPIASGVSPSYAGMKHGGSRKMTEDSNTSISAIALLCMPGPDRTLLQVFHNRFAAIPLDGSLLTSEEVVHYALRDDPREQRSGSRSLSNSRPIPARDRLS